MALEMASREEQSDSFLNSDTVGDEFFIGIVENKLKITRDKFKLRLVLMSSATGKNENYQSEVYRAKIKIEILKTGERKAVDVIIKVLLTTMEMMKAFSPFPRERCVYEDILTSFEKILRDLAGEEIKFGPRSIKFETDPYEIIVIDDLKVDGYKMLDRKVGLNMEQTKMILAKLAKFHAVSTIRYQKDGVVKTFFDRKASMPPMPADSPMVKLFSNMFTMFVEALKAFGDCDEYADKISKCDPLQFMMLFVTAADPMRCGFHVMNHGDLWINNLMFKSDEEGNPIDVFMIDFQACFWGSPANDIFYFLITSVGDSIKVKHFDELIQFYHEQLVDGLKKLNYGLHIPTLAELHVDLLDKRLASVMTMMTTLAGAKYEANEEINMQQMIASSMDPEGVKLIYHNDNYKKAVKLWLAFFNERGFLDARTPVQ